MSAISGVLAGLVDYAGLYPPASLDMRTALENYRAYRAGKHGFALGRFIIDVNRIVELRVLSADLGDVKLSATVSKPDDRERVFNLLDEGVPIESVECKAGSRADVERMTRDQSAALETYVEIPVEPIQADVLAAVSDAGVRIKLRMGGLVAEAFPPAAAVARALAVLARERLPFKATAGLHHPLRASHRLTYAPDSPSGPMHGFINLLSAAALLHFGGNAGEAEQVLAEEDPSAWRLTRQSLDWRSHSWSTEQLAETRKRFFISFGSCSFEEPIRDLEALGWL